MQEQELFQSYEVKNWNFSPRIYKILAFSAVFNVLALLIVAQSNLLTTKGCDSPLVGGVCQVLDLLYVGGTVLTTDREMINEDYTKTELENADIVWIDQTGADKFKYPEGYFALSNPESVIPQEITGDGTFPPNIPGIPNPTTGGTTDLMNQPQVLPTPNDNAVTNLPTSPYDFKDNPTIPKPNRIRKPKNQKNPTLSNTSPNNLDLGDKTATTDEKDPNKTVKNPTEEKIEEVVINQKPMKDFASVVKTQYDKKEVDLSQNFRVVAEGVLTKDGKLDITEDKKTKQPKSRVLTAEGNEQMIEIAKQAIAAVGDSGWLGYLRNEGVEKINFSISQDNDNLVIIITSDQPTKERASTVSSKLHSTIQGALLLTNNGVLKLGEDERTLLKSAIVTSQDNKFVLNFLLPKPVAQEMITRRLKEVEVKTTETKPSGSTAQIKENDKTSAK